MDNIKFFDECNANKIFTYCLNDERTNKLMQYNKEDIEYEEMERL